MTISQDDTRKDIDSLKEESEQAQNEDLGSSLRSRRTLLKGAAAIPVIMTVPSGAAAALTSSRCMAKNQKLAASTQPDWITGGPDTWVRKLVPTKTLVRDEGEDDSSERSSLRAVASYAYGNGSGGSNESFVVYQLDSSKRYWVDKEGRRYYPDYSTVESSTPGELAPGQTELQTEAASTASSQEWRPMQDMSKLAQPWAVDKSQFQWEKTEVSTTNSVANTAGVRVAENEDDSESDNTVQPKMTDGINTYSIKQDEGTQYVIAQINAKGNVVDYGYSSAYNHITGSCWASIH